MVGPVKQVFGLDAYFMGFWERSARAGVDGRSL
jgi:hypothetical protein